MSCKQASLKRRLLILTYKFCLISAFLPAVISPPAKSFDHGQPEIQQELDNLPPQRLEDVSRLLPSNAISYPVLLTHKATTLLSEAFLMLSKVKTLNERHWVEAFIVRLGTLATAMEESTRKTWEQTQENQTPNVTIQERVPSPGTGPKMLIDSSVDTQISPENKKLSVTAPQQNEMMHVNEAPPEHHVVTKPGLFYEKDKSEDELVWELREQSRLSHAKQPMYEYPVLKGAKEEEFNQTTPETALPKPKIISNNDHSLRDTEKTEVKVKPLKKEPESKRLSVVRENVKPVESKSYNFADFTNTNFSLESSYNSDEEANDFEIAEDDREEEEETSKKNLINEGGVVPNPWTPFKFNIDKIHHPDISGNFRNTNDMVKSKPFKDQTPNKNKYFNQFISLSPKNFHGYENRHEKINQNNLYPFHINSLNPNQFLENFMNQQMKTYQPKETYKNTHMKSNVYVTNKPRYIQNFLQTMIKSPKNHPNFLQHEMSSNFTFWPPAAASNNHSAAIKMSDDQKRQMRDGRIILLSDSLVHTNFGPASRKAEKRGNMSPRDQNDTTYD